MRHVLAATLPLLAAFHFMDGQRAFAQSLTVIQPPPGFQFTSATDVSADGQVVSVGVIWYPYSNERFTSPWRWTPTQGLQSMGPAGYDYIPMALSGDGSTIVGFRPLYSLSFISDITQGFRFFGDEGPVFGAQAFDLSHDAGVVVGTAQFPTSMYLSSAFRWDRTTSTYQDLGVLPGMINALAYAASEDGSVIAGWSAPGWNDPNSNAQPFRWTAQEGMQRLGLPVGDRFAFAFGVSADGTTIAGASWGASVRPVCWRNGSIEVLPFLPATTDGAARATSANGEVVVGALGFFRGDGYFTERAVLWSPHLGVVDLNQYLTGLGVDLDGFILQRALAVSADGRTIVGEGWYNDDNRILTYAFVATLPPHCGTSDFNNDADHGTDADIEAFFLCLAGHCCPACGTADFNADGDTGTDADVESFFRVLGGGNC